MSITVVGGLKPHPGPWPSHFDPMDTHGYSLFIVPKTQEKVWVPLGMKAKIWDPEDKPSIKAARFYIFGRPSPDKTKDLKALFPDLDASIRKIVEEFFDMNRGHSTEFDQLVAFYRRYQLPLNNLTEPHWLIQKIGVENIKWLDAAVEKHWWKMGLAAIGTVAFFIFSLKQHHDPFCCLYRTVG